MNKQLKVAELQALSSVPTVAVFDLASLARSTMDDVALQSEVIALFIDQLAKLEGADWKKLDLNFEMHALRGAAAAIGAMQIEMICAQWEKFGVRLEGEMKQAIAAFCAAAAKH